MDIANDLTSRVKFQGCYPDGFSESDPTLACGAGDTLAANDGSRYRHFAVDDINDVVYFCDQSPNDRRPKLHCFANNRGYGVNGYQWMGASEAIGPHSRRSSHSLGGGIVVVPRSTPS